jgi:hypothetical protein
VGISAKPFFRKVFNVSQRNYFMADEKTFSSRFRAGFKRAKIKFHRLAGAEKALKNPDFSC